MKKNLSLILAVLMCLTALCACTTDTPDTSGVSGASVDEPSTAISYDEVSYFVPGGDESATEESQTENSEPNDPSTKSSADDSQPSETSKTPEQLTGKFEVKVAKYDYNNYMERQFGDECPGGPFSDVSIAILNVLNGTDKHYSMTIHGKYLDKDGNVLKTETQEWDQFAAGWQKYFLFRPEMAFDKFEYTIETKEFKGDCWKTGISETFLKLEKDNRTVYPPDMRDPETAVHPRRVEGLTAVNNIDFPMPFCHGYTYFVLFDEDGQVIGVYLEGQGLISRPLKGESYGETVYHANPDDNGGKFDEWPEVFRGNVTGINIFSWIDDADKLEEHISFLE